MLTLSKPPAHSYDSGDGVIGYMPLPAVVGGAIAVGGAAAGAYAYLNSKGAWIRDDMVDYTYHNNVLTGIKITKRRICKTDFLATMCDVGEIQELGSTAETWDGF